MEYKFSCEMEAHVEVTTSKRQFDFNIFKHKKACAHFSSCYSAIQRAMTICTESMKKTSQKELSGKPPWGKKPP